jgi:Asp/Glu/hydantoin racemase
MPKRVLVIVPFPLDDEGVANRRLQAAEIDLGPDIQFDFEPVKAGAALLDSQHDWMLAELALFEVGMTAQERGYDAVCSDTMSDSGVAALRSALDIPVIGPGRASYLTALMLGNRFSVLTQWDGWIPVYRKGIHEAGLESQCASIRSINMRPDLKNLLGGKEEVVFPKLLAAAMQLVEEDGADVICLGSTTMHQSHAFLAEHLPVPIINPGPLSYKIADALLDCGLTQSRSAYPKPLVPKHEMIHAMLDAAKAQQES